jgi:hypothetical protein
LRLLAISSPCFSLPCTAGVFSFCASLRAAPVPQRASPCACPPFLTPSSLPALSQRGQRKMNIAVDLRSFRSKNPLPPYLYPLCLPAACPMNALVL